jgi:hypothetical protein
MSGLHGPKLPSYGERETESRQDTGFKVCRQAMKDRTVLALDSRRMSPEAIN